MIFIPANTLTSLEFDKVVQECGKYCISSIAVDYLAKGDFYTDTEVINNRLDEIVEMKASIDSDSPLSIPYYENIEDSIKNLHIKGFVISIEDLQKINNLFRGANAIISYFVGDKKEEYPRLYNLSNEFNLPPEINENIEALIDENGEIKDTASPELLSIARAIRSKQHEINKVFNIIANDLKNKGILSETVETFRNGRRVLSLPAENKRKIKGIIHDESATGKTVYIEPEKIIHLNNDLYSLQVDYNKEVYKLLRNISDKLRPFKEDIAYCQETIIRFDIISAKARLAIELDANKPNILPKPHFGFEKAYHPLLFLKNKKNKKKTIPFSLSLSKGNRILLISGPNAGGKSITLKSIGLLQLMVQSCYLIPASENSKVGVFKKMFIDIGDQQSLEDDLSTYSSRLYNMKNFVTKCDNKTLILIDEFGSGTDPNIGGAIAEAILREFVNLKTWGAFTTHYGNLKIYAYKARGIVNAAMFFDKENMKPTYELVVGKPGSSFAFEIAESTGLSNRILKYARFKAGKNVKKIEDVLVNIQNEKEELTRNNEKLKEKQNTLDQLIETYQKMHGELTLKKKMFKIEKKQEQLVEINKLKSEVNQEIKEIRKDLAHKKALELEKKIQEKKQAIEQEAKTLYKETSEINKVHWSKIEVGDFVKIGSSNITGKVIKISKKKADIQTDMMTISARIEELTKTNKPIATNSTIGINKELSNNSRFEPKIDIRGYTKEEAINSLRDFFDNALMSNTSLLTVLHGKGNGILKKTVNSIISEYNYDVELWHPPMEQGGDGITYIKFE